tara:strand:+ start:1445 stop:1600 length:156 start_codon:yes stop_codon:yes gene_type:complete
LHADAPVQTNNNGILATKEEVWAVSDVLVAICEENPLQPDNGAFLRCLNFL